MDIAIYPPVDHAEVVPLRTYRLEVVLTACPRLVPEGAVIELTPPHAGEEESVCDIARRS